MMEIEECREYGDGQVLLLVTWGWVDKTAFRDACTEWLCENASYRELWRAYFPRSALDPRDPSLLAAPELEHIEHSRWSLVPACILDTGRRCHPDCDCPVYFVRSKPHGRGDKYTVWDVEQALRRHWKYVDQQQTAQAQREG